MFVQTAQARLLGGLLSLLGPLSVSDAQVISSVSKPNSNLGFHRSLQVHITKIKSVNLDKWPDGFVEMYKYINNDIINSYWEHSLPSHF